MLVHHVRVVLWLGFVVTAAKNAPVLFVGSTWLNMNHIQAHPSKGITHNSTLVSAPAVKSVDFPIPEVALLLGKKERGERQRHEDAAG